MSTDVFGWFKSEQRERRRKVRLDRKHLEARTRRFLKSFLDADETQKPHFYHAVEAASKQCHPAEPLFELDDAQIAEATSGAAMKMVLERRVLKKNDPAIDFVTDAYATVRRRIPSRSRRLHHGQRDAGVRNGGCSPSHHGVLIHQRAEGLKISAMTRDQSRLLKIYDRVCWKNSATDLGTVIGTAWSGVTISWDDGQTTSIQHNDMAQVERVPMKVM